MGTSAGTVHLQGGLGIGVVTNPKSGANRRDPELYERLVRLVGPFGVVRAPESLEALDLVADEFCRHGVSVLGVHGGDGTLHVTLAAFVKAYAAAGAPMPPVAILPGGTLNTIAKGLRVARGAAEDVVENLVEHAREDRPIAAIVRPLLRIGEDLGFIWGNGLVANFLEAYYATGRPSPSTGGYLVARTVFSAAIGSPFTKKLMRRLKATVTVDGVRWPHEDWATLMAATVPEIGLGFAPFWRCWEATDRFPLIGFQCGALGLSAELPAIYRAQALNPDHATQALCAEAVIETFEPVPYTIDGDVHQAQPGRLVLRAGPALTFVVPDGA